MGTFVVDVEWNHLTVFMTLWGVATCDRCSYVSKEDLQGLIEAWFRNSNKLRSQKVVLVYLGLVSMVIEVLDG